MGDNEKTNDEQDSVIEEVKDNLKQPDLSLKDLKELESRLEARMQMIAKDKSKDAEDKAALEGRIEVLNERIERLIEAQEEKERKRNDSSTIIIPPAELDPPTHQNPTVESVPENPSSDQMRRKPKMRWW